MCQVRRQEVGDTKNRIENVVARVILLAWCILFLHQEKIKSQKITKLVNFEMSEKYVDDIIC